MKTYKGIVRSELNFDSFTGSKNCNFRAVIQFLFSHSYLLSGQLSLFLVPDQRRAVALSRVPVNIHVPLFSRLVCCLFSFFPVNAALPRYPTSPPSFVYKWHLSHRRPPPPPPPTSNPSKGIYLAVVGYATCQITGKELIVSSSYSFFLFLTFCILFFFFFLFPPFFPSFLNYVLSPFLHLATFHPYFLQQGWEENIEAEYRQSFSLCSRDAVSLERLVRKEHFVATKKKSCLARLVGWTIHD